MGVRRGLLPGRTVPQLVALSEQAQLLVVGSHGRTGRRPLGSVSGHVAAHADCPVAVGRPSDSPGELHGSGRRIVVGVDGSKESICAARVAALEAARPETFAAMEKQAWDGVQKAAALIRAEASRHRRPRTCDVAAWDPGVLQARAYRVDLVPLCRVERGQRSREHAILLIEDVPPQHRTPELPGAITCPTQPISEASHEPSARTVPRSLRSLRLRLLHERGDDHSPRPFAHDRGGVGGW